MLSPLSNIAEHLPSIQSPNDVLPEGILGWLGEAKVSYSFSHCGAQLILAYCWARPAVLAAGKKRGGMLLFLKFLYFLLFSSFFPTPLFHLLYYLFFYLSSPFLSETTQNDPQGLTCPHATQ